MIYKVFMNGTSIYESDGNVIILEPRLSQEVNTAGSFEFTMPAIHRSYDLPTLLTSEVEVYEGENMIFFGRPTEIELDIDLQKKSTVRADLLTLTILFRSHLLSIRLIESSFWDIWWRNTMRWFLRIGNSL